METLNEKHLLTKILLPKPLKLKTKSCMHYTRKTLVLQIPVYERICRFQPFVETKDDTVAVA
jgi:hypothetical protein